MVAVVQMVAGCPVVAQRASRGSRCSSRSCWRSWPRTTLHCAWESWLLVKVPYHHIVEGFLVATSSCFGNTKRYSRIEGFWRSQGRRVSGLQVFKQIVQRVFRGFRWSKVSRDSGVQADHAGDHGHSRPSIALGKVDVWSSIWSCFEISAHFWRIGDSWRSELRGVQVFKPIMRAIMARSPRLRSGNGAKSILNISGESRVSKGEVSCGLRCSSRLIMRAIMATYDP